MKYILHTHAIVLSVRAFEESWRETCAQKATTAEQMPAKHAEQATAAAGRIEEEEAIEQSISDPPPPLLLLHRSKLIVLEEQLAMVFYTTVRVLSYLCLASTRGIDDARMSATEETCLVKANGKV
jgi:hypothetical protein